MSRGVQFQKAVIVGPGLIGASLGMVLLRTQMARIVVGVARRRATLAMARRRGAITQGTADLTQALRGADLVVLATPVGVILELLPQVAARAAPGTLIIDAGSTKQEIVNAAARCMPPAVDFVGCHPLAGSEKNGPAAADSALFDGSCCFIVKTAQTRPAALSRTRALWRAVGARTVMIDAAEHDRIVSVISHVPHLISAALMNAVADSDTAYAAGGFRDTTRIAAGDAALWRDIFLTNQPAVLAAAAAFSRCWERLCGAVRDADGAALEQLLTAAQRRRRNLPGNSNRSANDSRH